MSCGMCRVAVGNSSVQVRGVAPEDEGYYTCIVGSSGGQVAFAAQLKIACEPLKENKIK